jgi:hypothetical protein
MVTLLEVHGLPAPRRRWPGKCRAPLPLPTSISHRDRVYPRAVLEHVSVTDPVDNKLLGVIRRRSAAGELQSPLSGPVARARQVFRPIIAPLLLSRSAPMR